MLTAGSGDKIMTTRVAIYLRVSTCEQTVENQQQALAVWATQRGYQIAATFADNGLSGSKGRDKRPGLDGALKAAVRGDFDILAAWHVDRLGRSLPDLVATLQELEAAGVDLFIHQQSLDTTTPAGRAMYGLLGVFAEFERSMIQGRVRAGLQRARKAGKRLGRPKVPAAKEAEIRRLLTAGNGILKTAKLAGVGSGTVQRVRNADQRRLMAA
jgi:DNA invertase Pin-like site-specific DNA recombinase